MKTALLITLGIIVGGLGVSAWTQQSGKSELRAQLQTALGYRDQLNTLAEGNARQRLATDARIDDLENQLLAAANQLSNLSAALQEAREQADPNYQQLLEQARREVAANQPRTRRGGAGINPLSDPDSSRSIAQATVDNNFAGFFESLSLNSAEQETLRATLVDFNANRLQLLRDLMSGELSDELALSYFGPDALLNSVADRLTPEQLDELHSFDLNLTRQSTREMYANMLDNNGGSLTGVAQSLVLDTLLDELYSAENNFGAMVGPDGSVISARDDRQLAFERTRSSLENDLSAEQLVQYDQFAQAQGNSIHFTLTAASEDGEQQEIQVMRVVSDNPPN